MLENEVLVFWYLRSGCGINMCPFSPGLLPVHIELLLEDEFGGFDHDSCISLAKFGNPLWRLYQNIDIFTLFPLGRDYKTLFSSKHFKGCVVKRVWRCGFDG